MKIRRDLQFSRWGNRNENKERLAVFLTEIKDHLEQTAHVTSSPAT